MQHMNRTEGGDGSSGALSSLTLPCMIFLCSKRSVGSLLDNVHLLWTRLRCAAEDCHALTPLKRPADLVRHGRLGVGNRAFLVARLVSLRLAAAMRLYLDRLVIRHRCTPFVHLPR